MFRVSKSNMGVAHSSRYPADILHTLFIVSEVEVVSTPLAKTLDSPWHYDAKLFSAGSVLSVINPS
jgi:hypothetical protein